MTSVVPIQTDDDRQFLSNEPFPEAILERAQSQPLTSLLKFIDQPIQSPKPKPHKAPFYSSLSDEMIQSISTGFCDVYQIKDPHENMHDKKLYQILKSPEKIMAIKLNFKNAIILTIHLNLLEKVLLFNKENTDQVNILSQQAIELYEEELDYLSIIPSMKKEAEELLKNEEALLADLKHTLGRHDGDEQEKQVSTDIIQCKMRICLLFNKLDIHFPHLLQVIPIYLQENRAVYDSLKAGDLQKDIQELNALYQLWDFQRIELINYAEKCLNNIMFSQIELMNSYQTYEKGLEVNLKSESCYQRLFNIAGTFSNIVNVRSNLDCILTLQTIRVPFLETKENVIIKLETKRDKYFLQEQFVTSALIQKESMLTQQIMMKNQEIMRMQIEQQHRLISNLQGQMNQLVYEQKNLSTDMSCVKNIFGAIAKSGIKMLLHSVIPGLGFLPDILDVAMNVLPPFLNVVMAGFSFPDFSDLAGGLKTMFGFVKSLAKGFSSLRKEKKLIPELVGKCELAAGMKKLESQMSRLGTMVNEQLDGARQKLAIVASEVSYLEGLLSSFETLNEELQKRSECIKNFPYFFDCLQRDRAQKFAMKFQLIGINFRNYYLRFRGDTYFGFRFSPQKLMPILKNYIRVANNCLCSCIVTKTNSSYVIETMSVNQMKNKLCKIIRRRLKVNNSIFTNYEKRLRELILSDFLELLGKSKVWGSFRQTSNITRIDSHKNFALSADGSGQLKSNFKKKLRRDVNLNPVLKNIVQELSIHLMN